MLLAAACGRTPIDEMDEVFYRFDKRQVVCAVSLDTRAGNDLDSVYGGLARAKDRGELLGIYAHNPGVSVSWDKLEAVLARIDELGLDFVTYPELERDDLPRRGGVLFSFDDAFVEHWFDGRELWNRYGAHLTFFVSRYDHVKPEQRAQLHMLFDDGHAVEAHGLKHERASDFVMENGLHAYISDELLPELDLLRADGFHPTVFAYPFGARTGELDRAILEHFDRVRSISFSLPTPVTDPCPE
jgi:peptidoglycan/xylan/chitin deacetylase (PgdA/CDA1 family)